MQFQFGGHWSNLIGTTSASTQEHILQDGEKIVHIKVKHGGAIDSIRITLNTGTVGLL